MNPEEGARRRLAAIALTDTPQGGPGGPVVDLLLMLAPLVFLVLVTISKRLYLPTSRSVPIAAGALYLFKLCYLGTAANPVTAALLQGVLLGLVPLSILFGAFFFYNVLDLTQCTEYVSMLVAQLCHGHPVAEVFLIVWGLGHAIEGASGFGTPGALLPPIAAGLGHDPFHCVVALLIATTTVGPFGSSGIGIWFGLAALDWPRAQLVHASFLVSLTMAVMSYPIGVMAARFLLSWKDMRRCWLFVLLSITSGAVPALAVAMFSFEVPALFSGVTAVVVTGLLARYRIGLTDDIPAMAARRLGKQTQQRQVAIDIPVDGTVQLELAAVPVVQQGAPGQAAPATAQDCPPAVPGYDRRPSFRTLRSRTVSGEDSSVSGAGNTALQLLSALNSPRRRASQQQQQQGGGGGLSRDSSRGTTSASSEMLLPGSRSHSAPSLSELLKASPPVEHLAGSHAGAAEKGSLVALPDVTTKSNGTSSNQLLPVSNTLPSKSSGNKGDGRSKHWKVVPWVMMMSVVAATRIPYLQKSNGQEMFISLRSLCDVRVASNLVITVDDILRTGTKWSYAMLYVPSLLPFVAVGCITLVLFRRNIPKAAHWGDPFKKSWNKCKSVMMALLSALVLVALMIQGELQSPAFIIGYWLSTWLKGGYIAVAMLLGAMGAFFSGSVATSNLTFGLLQEVAALRLQMPGAPMLMLQIVGGAAGQMISISNILGARAVMNLQHIPEGRFVNAALPACLLYYVIGTLISLPFLLGA